MDCGDFSTYLFSNQQVLYNQYYGINQHSDFYILLVVISAKGIIFCNHHWRPLTLIKLKSLDIGQSSLRARPDNFHTIWISQAVYHSKNVLFSLVLIILVIKKLPNVCTFGWSPCRWWSRIWSRRKWSDERISSLGDPCFPSLDKSCFRKKGSKKYK